MALETLKGITEIGGFPVRTDEDIHKLFHQGAMGSAGRPLWCEWRSKHPIIVDHLNNTLSFKIQDGPIKEVGQNGCQVDTIIHATIKIIEGLDAKFPDPDNKKAIEHLYLAVQHLNERTRKRAERGVEGTSQA